MMATLSKGKYQGILTSLCTVGTYWTVPLVKDVKITSAVYRYSTALTIRKAGPYRVMEMAYRSSRKLNYSQAVAT